MLRSLSKGRYCALAATCAYAVLCSLVTGINGECPNSCSGNGVCGIYDRCECYKGFTGGDCSHRLCPFGHAWTDVHKGDLNHDGSNALSDEAYVMDERRNANLETPEFFPTKKEKSGFVADPNEAHFYQECSAKGICERETGSCRCFRGYTGSSCQRSTCPSQCNGHGTCRSVGDIASGALNKREVDAVGGERKFEGVQQPFEYQSWDKVMQHACICDPGYFGMDCSMRDCPRGDDPLTNAPYTCGGETCRNHKQTISFDMSVTVTEPGMFALVFTDHFLTEWETYGHRLHPGNFNSTASDLLVYLENSLESIPGNVVPNVRVTCHTVQDDLSTACTNTELTQEDQSFHITIEFIRPTGVIYPLKVNHYGNSWKAAAIDSGEPAIVIPQDIRSDQVGNKERSPCSNRGLCNHRTGLCSCFPGYTYIDCSVQDVAAGKVRSGEGLRNRQQQESARTSGGSRDLTVSETTSDTQDGDA